MCLFSSRFDFQSKLENIKIIMKEQTQSVIKRATVLQLQSLGQDHSSQNSLMGNKHSEEAQGHMVRWAELQQKLPANSKCRKKLER